MCIICHYKDIDDYYTNFNRLDNYTNLNRLDDICENINFIPGDLINLETLILEGGYDNIVTISNKLIKLKYITCISGALISYIPDTFINLINLNCIDTGLTYIPSTLINLIHLDCSHNDIIELPDTLINLTYLDCSYNKIIELPDFFNLTYLNCSENKLDEIPDTLINLTYLDCSENNLYELPDTLSKLVKLKTKNNIFNYLPDTFINLEHLNISNSTISKIPKTFIKLKKLVMILNDNSYNYHENSLYILFVSIKKLINLESIISFSFTDYDSLYFAFSSDEIINYINTGIIIYGLYFPETVKKYHYKKHIQKKLLKYANLITDKYLNPKSPFVEYICKNLVEKRNNELGYIDSNNELKIFKIKNNN